MPLGVLVELPENRAVVLGLSRSCGGFRVVSHGEEEW
jgi:hypothetical protein